MALCLMNRSSVRGHFVYFYSYI